MNINFKKGLAGLFSLAFIAASIGCDDEEGTPIAGEGDMVTVSGFALSIDDGAIAEGVAIWLLDNESDYITKTAVGPDGTYSLEVPAGSRMLLMVDDFASSKRGIGGDWYPFLNFDELNTPKVPKGGLENHIVHGCPQSKGNAQGSVAVFEAHLSEPEGDAANGDLFVPESTDDASMLLGIFFESNDGGFAFTNKMNVTVDEDGYDVRYAILEKIFDENAIPTVALGPDFVYPASRSKTDFSGMFLDIFESRTDTITVNVTDTDTDRGLDFTTPLEVPIRPNVMSTILGASIDGEANQTILDLFVAAGFF